MLHTDGKPLFTLLKNPMEQRQWRLIHSRYTESSKCPDAEDHDSSEVLVRHTEGFEFGLKSWELHVGKWERASRTPLADAVKLHSDDCDGICLSQEQLASVSLCRQ